MKRECSFDLRVLIWHWLLMCLFRKDEPSSFTRIGNWKIITPNKTRHTEKRVQLIHTRTFCIRESFSTVSDCTLSS